MFAVLRGSGGEAWRRRNLGHKEEAKAEGADAERMGES